MKNKKRIFILIFLGVALVFATTFYFLILRMSPKKKITKALINTCSSFTAVTGTSSDQLLGMKKIHSVLGEQSAEIYGDFSITFINKMVKCDFLEGVSFSVTGKRDLTHQEAYLDFCLGKTNPLELSTYLTKDKFVFLVPGIEKTSYYIDFAKINETFEDSLLGSQFDLPELTGYAFRTTGGSAASKLCSSFLANRKDDFILLFSDISTEKISSKKSITTLDGVKKCTSYEVTLPKHSIQTFFVSMEEYLNANTAASLDLSEESYVNLKEDISSFNSFLSEHLEDMEFTVSLDRKGTLREFFISYEKLSCTILFTGAKTNTDAISLELEYAHENHPVVLAYEESVSMENDSDLYQTELMIYPKEEPEKKISLTTKNSFSKETLAFSNSMKLLISDLGINAELSMDGKFTDYVKNESFYADIENLSLKVFGIRILSLQGELFVSPLKERITPLEPMVDVFDVTKDTVNEVITFFKEYIDSLK